MLSKLLLPAPLRVRGPNPFVGTLKWTTHPLLCPKTEAEEEEFPILLLTPIISVPVLVLHPLLLLLPLFLLLLLHPLIPLNPGIHLLRPKTVDEVFLTLLLILILLPIHLLPLLLPLNPEIYPRLRPKAKDEDPSLILLLFLITSVPLLDLHLPPLLLPLNPWILLPLPPFLHQKRQDVSVPNTFTPP